MNQNFFKVDHRYNPTRPRPLPLQYPRIQPSSSSTSNKVVVAASGPTPTATSNSYYERINSILSKWHQLQEEEKQKKKTKYQEKDEFNCRMEENLQNQLYELEQVMNEHLEQEYSQHSINEYKQDDMEQFIEMQKLLTVEDQKLKKYPAPLPPLQKQQSKLMDFDLWKQKHELYLKQMMNKAHQMQTNKIIRLLKAYYRTKKYYVQASKQYKN